MVYRNKRGGPNEEKERGGGRRWWGKTNRGGISGASPNDEQNGLEPVSGSATFRRKSALNTIEADSGAQKT